MRRDFHNSRRAGFSMIEILFAIGILGTLIGVLSLVNNSSSGAYSEATTASEVNAQAKLVLDRIAMELQSASTGTFNPELNAGVTSTSNLTFQQLVDIDGVTGAPIFGGPDPNQVMSIQLLIGDGELEDGVDNDGDGQIDERRIVLTRNVGTASAISTTMCGNVRSYLEGELAGGGDENGNGIVDERGFVIQRNGDVLTLRLTVEKQNSRGNLIVRTVETAIRLRN